MKPTPVPKKALITAITALDIDMKEHFSFRKSEDDRHPRWSRIDDRVGDHTHVTGPDDMSPVHFQSTGYDERCNWCWLGYSHSEAEHAREIAKATN